MVTTTASYQLPEFKDYRPFIPKFTEGRVVKTYDCDTITVVAPVEDTLYRWSVRLDGIDAPEIRSKVPREAKCAKAGRHYLAQRILGETVKLEIKKSDKYGRLLCRVFYGGSDMSEEMIDNGYAQAYDGGKKSNFDDRFFSKFT